MSMRIKMIDLIGYIGFYNGMQLNQVTIDFTRCMYNKIIIRGKNGSGKSTLMHALSLEPDTNYWFVPGMEARKTVVVICDGIEYMIRYIHPVNTKGERLTTKAYIAKLVGGQYVELNPNGNVSSAAEVRYDEFGLDANYTALSKLSSEDKGLVSSRPAERKKLVNSIISTLDVYNGIYKNLSKKSASYKQLINSLTYKINRIGDQQSLSNAMYNMQQQITQLEKDQEDAIRASAELKLKIEEYEKILKDNNYDDIMAEYNELSKLIISIRNHISKELALYSISSIENLSDYIESIDKAITATRSALEANSITVPNLLTQRESQARNLESINTKLQALQTEHNYLDLKRLISEAQKTVDEYDAVFKKMGLKDTDLITKDEFDYAMQAIDTILHMTNNLYSSHSQQDFDTYLELNESDLQAHYDIIEKHLLHFNGKIKELEAEYNLYEANLSIAKELNNRPKDCTIDSCPYIAAALKAHNTYPESKFEEIGKELNRCKEAIVYNEKEKAKYTIALDINLKINEIKNVLVDKWVFIKKLPLPRDFIDIFVAKLLSFKRFDELENLYAYRDCSNMLEEYNLAKKQLAEYKSEAKIYESTDVVIESLINDMNRLSEDINKIDNLIDSINGKTVELTAKLDKLKIDKAKLESVKDQIDNQFKVSIERKDELEKIKKSLEFNTSALKEWRNDLSILDTNIGHIKADIKAANEKNDELKHAWKMLIEYNNELAQYNDSYTKIEKIRYYSSPSTGIQTLFMQLYMNKLLTTANELLSLLFEGEFMLMPFVINEDEFRIPCIGNGLLHDDISSMSTAQKSMISMILSFALLNQSSSKYNIVFLDEIDGGLDTGNRGHFIMLLDRIMQMLQCEQCFIVSHNNELDTSMADLIVLKTDPGETYGGNIIWKY